MSQQPANRPAESPPDAMPLDALLGALEELQAQLEELRRARVALEAKVEVAQQRAPRRRSEADRAALRRSMRQFVLRLSHLSPAQQAARIEQVLTSVQEALEDEGIDYSDIPDVGDDGAYWTGGWVGPVLPVKATERPG